MHFNNFKFSMSDIGGSKMISKASPWGLWCTAVINGTDTVSGYTTLRGS